MRYLSYILISEARPYVIPVGSYDSFKSTTLETQVLRKTGLIEIKLKSAHVRVIWEATRSAFYQRTRIVSLFMRVKACLCTCVKALAFVGPNNEFNLV